MKILALETTGKHASAALIGDDGTLNTSRSLGEMSHLTDIMGLTESCLAAIGTDKSELTHVAASVGPGSFTGIRIGVSIARALGEALNIPCIAVPTLEAMMLGTLEWLDAEGEIMPETHICTIINARRHQTYGAIWSLIVDTDGGEGGEPGGLIIHETLKQGQYMIEDIMAMISRLSGAVVMTGDGIDAYEGIIQEYVQKMQDVAEIMPPTCSGFNPRKCGGTYPEVLLMPEDVRYQSAESVAKVAMGKAFNGDTVVYDKLLPVYMRKTEAEMKLEEGSLSSKISEM